MSVKRKRSDHSWSKWGDPVLNGHERSHQFRRCKRCEEVQMRDTHRNPVKSSNITKSIDKKKVESVLGFIVACVVVTFLILSLI